MMMDEAFHWRHTFSDAEFETPKKLAEIRVEIPDSIVLEIDKKVDELKCEMTVVDDSEVKMSPLDFPHPGSSRIVVVEIQPVSDSVGNVYLGGSTYFFKQGFETLGIPWQHQSNSNNAKQEKKEIVRILCHLNFDNTKECVAKLNDVFGPRCLCHSPVLLRLQFTEFKPDLFLKLLASFEHLGHVRVER